MLFRCTNLKRSDFDPITEIIRNLFRFHFWGTNNIGNAKEFRQILQTLNWPGAKPFSQKTRIQRTLRGAREATFRQ